MSLVLQGVFSEDSRGLGLEHLGLRAGSGFSVLGLGLGMGLKLQVRSGVWMMIVNVLLPRGSNI